MKTIQVVAGIVIHQDKILCVQRGLNKYNYISHKWEFPGGKVEPGETEEEGVQRELLEELNLQVRDLSHYITIEHSYPDFHLVMHCYLCHCDNPKLELTEHIAFKWLAKDELGNLDWAQADWPIVEKLKSL